jgi:hypothetical protein
MSRFPLYTVASALEAASVAFIDKAGECGYVSGDSQLCSTKQFAFTWKGMQ